MAKKALIIANSRYDDERFAPLPGAAADAATLACVLADPAIEEFTVETVVDTGLRATMRAIQLFFSSAKASDLLLLHLSLHGWKDIRNRLYFIACDTERDLPEATAMSADFVSDLMGQSRSERIVLLLDCCYSGAFTAGMIHRSSAAPQVNVSEPFAGKGRVVITSSTSLQFAHESDPSVLSSQAEAQPSPFTAAVVKGLRDGAADLDRDGRISVSELYEYVHTQVLQKVPGQTPTLSVNNAQGTIYLTRSARSPDIDISAEPDATDDLMLDRISSTETELDKLAARRDLLEERIRVCATQIEVSGQLIDQLLEGDYKDGLRREIQEIHERRAQAHKELSALIAYMSSIERRTEYLEE
jgi:molecular chaperone DnaK